MAAAGDFIVTVSCVIHDYHVYKEVWNPSIGKEIVCFAEEENSHHRKAVISRQTTSPSVTLLLNFRQVQVQLSSTIQEVCITIKQYPWGTALAEIRSSAEL